MLIKAEITNISTTKKGMKIVLGVGDADTKKALQFIYNFVDKPLVVNIEIDTKEQISRLNMISEEQRKKIYAIFKDIANWQGDTVENVKEIMKHQFIQDTEYQDFSLSNCSSDLANRLIEYLIAWCFMGGVRLKEHPKDLIEDIEQYMYICLHTKKCAICGKPGEIHHVDSIGTGRNRNSFDDSSCEKICLCRIHHSEAHQIGWETFSQKYHVVSIRFEEVEQ